MFDQSVIKKTGQSWKAWLSCVTVIGGGASTFYGLSYGSLLFPVLIGIVLVGFGLVFACTAIRCPSCGARWVWLGFKGQNAMQWLPWLLNQAECPVCQGAIQPPVTADRSASRNHR